VVGAASPPRKGSGGGGVVSPPREGSGSGGAVSPPARVCAREEEVVEVVLLLDTISNVFRTCKNLLLFCV